MTVKGITNPPGSYTAYTPSKVAKSAATGESSNVTASDNGVIYEPALGAPTQTFKANEEVIARFKKDAEERMVRLQNLVEQLISRQGSAFADAREMWNALREGNVKADPETRAKAQADIAEDGYWGVKATSDRIIDFATALTGNDKTKLGEMVDAFKKGYEKAEKIWGGKLPEISKQTYDAVLEKFDNLMNSSN